MNEDKSSGRPSPVDLTPATVADYRPRLTRGEDVVDPEAWAGHLPAADGIAPRVRVGSSKWFNLLWLLPIGWGLLLVAVAEGLRSLFITIRRTQYLQINSARNRLS